MQNKTPQHIQLEFTSEFKRNIRALSKKYRHIRSDLQEIISELQLGKILGNKIKGVKYDVFKMRIKNSDIQKGKRAGYRLIYWCKSIENIILITIYSKLDQTDISAQQIKKIIEKFGNR